MASHDAGVEVECPGCAQVVLQKGMIPVLGPDGTGIRYLCPACARALIVPPTDAASGGDDGDEVDADDAGASPGAAPEVDAPA